MCKQITLSIWNELHWDAVQSLVDPQGKHITSVEYNSGSNSYVAKYYSLFQYIFLL